MTYVSFASQNAARCSRDGIYQNVIHHTVPGFAVLCVSALIGAGMLYLRPVAPPSGQMAQVLGKTAVETSGKAIEKAAPARVAASKSLMPSRAYVSLLDPSYTFGLAPVPFKPKTAIASAFEPKPMVPPPSSSVPSDAPMTSDSDEVPPPIVAEVAPAVPLPAETSPDVPLPLPRPHEFRAPANIAAAPAPVRATQQVARNVPAGAVPGSAPPASAAPQSGGFFDKLFGGASQPSGPALAYAAPEDGIVGSFRRITSGRPLPYDRWTAVYEISSHTVHMPNGTKLEAHSGLGSMLDDPRYVDQRMRGATPPAVYDLTPRETLFHGVQALRLTPVGGGDTYGRGGLLAHTFMLGPRGDSNGCVVFRNYNAFLQSYMRGEIKQLAVVARL